jgi:hypothetical protein
MLVLNLMEITLLVPDLYRTNLEGGISLNIHATRPPFKWDLIINLHACLLPYEDSHIVIKRLLQYIFHIDPGISPRLQYQARQWSWMTDMGRGLIPRTIWKSSCHNLFITYFTLTFFKHWPIYVRKHPWTDKLRKQNPLENCLSSTCKYFHFEFCTLTLESVCIIYPRRWHLNGNSYSRRRIHLS